MSRYQIETTLPNGIVISVPVPDEFIEQLLDNHAHRLAERIRNSEELRDLTDDHMSDCIAAADLIDPGTPEEEG